MARVRRINVSQIDGDYSNGSDKRPSGEMALYEDNGGGFDLVIHDGVNSPNLNKVLGKGKFYGHNADSGDGAGYDTIKLIPDIPAYNGGSDQYLIVDPTGPNHIHIRAGGTQDNSSTELFLGGEVSNFKVGAGLNPTVTISSNSNVWTFDSNSNLRFPMGGAIEPAGMGWTGLTNGTAETPVSVVYKTNTGTHQSAITLVGGNDVDGVGAIYVETYNDITNTSHQWTFSSSNGSLTFPDSTEQVTAWAGGRIVAAPTHSTGAAGDKPGDLAFNGSYIYYCTQQYYEASYASTIVLTYTGTFPSIVKGSIPQPLSGWILVHNGNSYTLDANATEGNPGEWSLSLSSSISVTAGDAVTIGPASVADIWKRVAWSNDTW